MSAKFKVVPVRRRDGDKGPWIMTAEHKAQAWAVACFRPGERVAFIVYSFSKSKAENALAGTERMFAGPLRRYRLGARMGAKPSQGEQT